MAAKNAMNVDLSLQTVFDAPVASLHDAALRTAIDLCEAHARRAVARLDVLRREYHRRALGPAQGSLPLQGTAASEERV